MKNKILKDVKVPHGFLTISFADALNHLEFMWLNGWWPNSNNISNKVVRAAEENSKISITSEFFLESKSSEFFGNSFLLTQNNWQRSSEK